MYLAVSGCLLGQNLRHNGGHTRDPFITESLGAHATYVPFCPEDLAFGTPREALRIVNHPEGLRIESSRHAKDLTEPLTQSATRELQKISAYPLSGIILKSKSPSCGLGSAMVYRPNGYSQRKEDGLFARLCKAHFPLLPIEEEGRLHDPWLRENFIMQLFAYHDFEMFRASDPTMQNLITFHQRYKFMLHAKSETHYRALGKIVGNHENQPFESLLDTYGQTFKETIASKSSIGKTRNVLEHMAGFLKKEITPEQKRILHEQIYDYSKKIIPLITPLSTIAMLAQTYQVNYLTDQKFLTPYPKELALRSDIRSGK